MKIPKYSRLKRIFLIGAKGHRYARPTQAERKKEKQRERPGGLPEKVRFATRHGGKKKADLKR